MKLFWILIVKTPRTTKIIHFAKKQNNIQAFFDLHTRPIQSFVSVDSSLLSSRSLCSILFSRKNHSRKTQYQFYRW